MVFTRSGGGGVVKDKTEETPLVRGSTRSKGVFRRSSRGNYDSLPVLRRAHQRLYSLEPLFAVCGEFGDDGGEHC